MTSMGKKRSHIINSPTLFEYLPNEILISIFSYLNGIDGVLAFSNLNFRFYSLSNQCCYLFNFKGINKTKFDFIINQQYNKQQWKSLQLSNDYDTPGQIEYFCQSYSLIDLCPQLQSLSLLNIEYISQSLSFTNLKSLTIESLCGTIMSRFDLSKLKRLVINTCRDIEWMKDLSQLENLEYTIMNNCSCQSSFVWPPTLKRLKIIFTTSEDLTLIEQSFVCLSQLIILEMYQSEQPISFFNIEGYTWERLIRSLFPLLQQFRFYFLVYFAYIPHIIQSFSTPFYLTEKKWFIRCDVSSQKSPYNRFVRATRHYGALYSLPLTFPISFIYRDRIDKSISTLPEDFNNDSYTNMYTNMKTLILCDDMRELDENFDQIRIINLFINGYMDSLNWKHMLLKLQHLSLSKDIKISSETFESLLNNTPELYSLEVDISFLDISTNNWTNITICNQLSNKIRHLKFHSATNIFQCFGKSRLCNIFSIFAGKCTYLSLSIQSKLDLVAMILKRMKHLHSLHIHITEREHIPITMEWFEQHKTKFYHSNCLLIKQEQNYYFWL